MQGVGYHGFPRCCIYTALVPGCIVDVQVVRKDLVVSLRYTAHERYKFMQIGHVDRIGPEHAPYEVVAAVDDCHVQLTLDDTKHDLRVARKVSVRG